MSLSQAIAGIVRGDKPRRGTHYQDRVQRIMGACHAMGILWREQRTLLRSGDLQVDRITQVHEPSEVLLTPQYEKYPLRVDTRVLARIRNMAPQFAHALNVAAVLVEVDGDTVYVCVPRDAQALAVVSYEAAWALEPDLSGALLLGITDDGSQAVLDLEDAAHPHAAAIGMTGSGKSTLMQVMAMSALEQRLTVALLDPTPRHKSALWPLSGHPNIWHGGMFGEPDAIEWALSVLASGDASDVLVFVDEVPDLCQRQPDAAEHIKSLAQAGRNRGVHLVLGSQYATKIPALANVAARLVGRVADRTQSYYASGASGCEQLRGKGDMRYFCGSTAAHFQAALCSPALLAEWTRNYPPRAAMVEAQPPTRQEARPASEPDPAKARMLKGIPPHVIRDIRFYHINNKAWPSKTWLEKRYGYRRDVAERAMNCAALRMGLELPFPDWEKAYSDKTVKVLEVPHA